MRWTRSYIPTLRDAPQDAEVISHQLMMRAGMMRKVASGIYSFLPLGLKVIQKVSDIIREELNRSGAHEVQLPVVQPKELWEESGRWQIYGKELGRFTDRHENQFCLQPTSEEAIVDLVRRDVRSYRQLPLNLYQIQTKFRDEVRPRFGVMRGREFLMKDAYSFHLTSEDAHREYEEMRRAYRRIFSRTGLEFRAVDAHTGAIGGSRSEEFTVLAASGEDEVVSCESCTYAANQEKATSRIEKTKVAQSNAQPEEFPTPGLKTIEALAHSLKVHARDLMKTMIATDATGRCIVVLLRGSDELHEVKLQATLAASHSLQGVRLASDSELEHWKLPKGSLGPHCFPFEALVVVDDALDESAFYVTGANRDGFHYRNVQLERDVKVAARGTLRSVRAGDPCTRCGSRLQIHRGIEVGHVFYLGTKYSKAMNLAVTNELKQEQIVEMGCYGIGVTRTVAACIEQNHDAQGIIWPLNLAPFACVVVPLGDGEPVLMGERIYAELIEQGVDCILDDRSVSAGVKLNDCDLIGIPIQIIIGQRSLKEGRMEWKLRRTQVKESVAIDEVVKKTIAFVKDESQRLKEKTDAAAA